MYICVFQLALVATVAGLAEHLLLRSGAVSYSDIANTYRHEEDCSLFSFLTDDSQSPTQGLGKEEQSKNKMAAAVADRIKGALYGAMIADALAFPSHWYYGGNAQVRRAYGKNGITGYVDPEERLPGSIMSKSSTGGGGRGSYKGDIIGSVIFHGKKKFWQPGADYHYHHALKAGDNTLEILLMRRAIDIISQHDGNFASEEILKDYIKFMTTPGTHNDTYCGTCHRMFFANYASEIEPANCPDNDGHNVDTVDSVVTTIPVALLSADDSTAYEQVQEMVGLTRNSNPSKTYAKVFASMIRQVAIEGVDARTAVSKTGKEVFKMNLSSKAQDPVTACYLSSSFPSVLQMVYKYSPSSSASQQEKTDAFMKGVIANANRGGENVGTGTLIGALLGANCGYSGLPQDLLEGLSQSSKSEREKIDLEIEKYLSKNPIISSL
mmetsp:Transcript_9724/g.12144  ORF Transcript_9724/g.12144 Transcript_9724/m.12144 type:complete len:438 (+) Transcript_9724:112-1425(+)